MKVLVVDDDPYLVEALKLGLELQWPDCQVVGAQDGDSGLEILSSEHPDIVLLDIQLPGTDGYQLLALLRGSVSAGLPPVVALTAHAMSGDREKAIAAGFDGYLTKPIDVGTFGQSVEGFLRS